MRVRGWWAVRGVSIPSLPGVRLDCLRNSPLPRRPLRQVLASDCEAGSRAARPRSVPLRRSHRDDRNVYIERLIRSPDEGVMPPGRPAPRSDRSRDRSDRSETPSPS